MKEEKVKRIIDVPSGAFGDLYNDAAWEAVKVLVKIGEKEKLTENDIAEFYSDLKNKNPFSADIFKGWLHGVSFSICCHGYGQSIFKNGKKDEKE